MAYFYLNTKPEMSILDSVQLLQVFNHEKARLCYVEKYHNKSDFSIQQLLPYEKKNYYQHGW